MRETIRVPEKRFIEGKPFYGDTKAEALRALQSEGFEALFMPEILDARIETGILDARMLDARIDAEPGSYAWTNSLHSLSLKATGRPGCGKGNEEDAVVIYAHVPNEFSTPDGILLAISKGLVNGAGKLPQEEFDRLYNMAGNETVLAVPYLKLKDAESDFIHINKALQHPQTIPFCGGEARAKRYLAAYGQAYSTDEIGIWHLDDLHDEPLARFLCAGFCGDSLFGDNLDASARFVGVHRAERSELTLS